MFRLEHSPSCNCDRNPLIDLALDGERAGVPSGAVAKPGCSAGLIAMAEQVRALVAEMRAELERMPRRINRKEYWEATLR